ncbi:MAG TPA: hypothetical protein VLT36_05955 [Candidatus Dormibacteraeota bacterium]|nr:hypothetical protein [Candidatus Dormibacteraeota bacterium]
MASTDQLVVQTTYSTQSPLGAGGDDVFLPVLLATTAIPPLPPLNSGQQLLFPSTPRAVCHEVGLNWWAALKLFEDGWLSFSPEDTQHLEEAQERELRFVASLVLAGCDRPMLASLLSGLPKPYAQHATNLYYDWLTRHWRPLPDSHPEAAFTAWLDSLVESRDFNSLSGILELTNDALSRLRS